MTITWLGHACFLIETAEGSVVFDPYEPGSVPGVELPALRADAVVCSHGHGDHSYAEAVALSGEEPHFTLKQIPCFHDGVHGALRGKNLITVLEAEGLRLAHFGDLGHPLSAEQLAEIGQLDVALLPVGGHYTINAKEAAALVEALRPKLTIPMHYRGPGFGYIVIETVDDFLKRVDNVRFWPSNVIDPSETDAPVVVLKCPTK